MDLKGYSHEVRVLIKVVALIKGYTHIKISLM
jgi:hypothetical protein